MSGAASGSTPASLPWESWNPVSGCTHVSEGCRHCYAERFAERWRGLPGHHYERGFDLQLRPKRLKLPRRWKRPRRVFHVLTKRRSAWRRSRRVCPGRRRCGWA